MHSTVYGESVYFTNRNFKSLTKNMYSKRKLSIRLSSGTTHYFSSSNGLKQGCSLSPVLLSLL